MLEELEKSFEDPKYLQPLRLFTKIQIIKPYVNKFDNFLEGIVSKNVEKVLRHFKKRLTLMNWILVNATVFAYHLGKTNSEEISFIEIFFRDYELIGGSFIIANVLAYLLPIIKSILKSFVKFILWIILGFLCVLFFRYVVENSLKYFKGKFSNS